MCYYHICTDIFKLRGPGVRHKAWAEYLLYDFNDNDCDVQKRVPCDVDIIDKIIGTHFATTYTTESDENGFKACTIFESYHYHAATPISDSAILAGSFIL